MNTKKDNAGTHLWLQQLGPATAHSLGRGHQNISLATGADTPGSAQEGGTNTSPHSFQMLNSSIHHSLGCLANPSAAEQFYTEIVLLFSTGQPDKNPVALLALSLKACICVFQS